MTMYIHHRSTFLPDTQATLSYKEACTHSLSASPSMAAMHTLTLCLTLNGCHAHTHSLPHPQWLPCTHSLSASPSMAAMHTLTICLTLNGCPQWLPCTHSLSASPSMAAMHTLTLSVGGALCCMCCHLTQSPGVTSKQVHLSCQTSHRVVIAIRGGGGVTRL